MTDTNTQTQRDVRRTRNEDNEMKYETGMGKEKKQTKKRGPFREKWGFATDKTPRLSDKATLTRNLKRGFARQTRSALNNAQETIQCLPIPLRQKHRPLSFKA